MTREEYINFANALKNNYTIDFDKLPEFCDMAISLSKNKGKWITDETSGSALNDRYYCSNCGKELKMPYTVIKAEQENGKYLFCDRCGADMRPEPYGGDV